MKLVTIPVVYLDRDDLSNGCTEIPMDQLELKHFKFTAIEVIKNADVALFQEERNLVTKVIKTRY